MTDLSVTLGEHALRSVLIAACGTVGSVVDFADTIDFSPYGAAVAKSVSREPWMGRPWPRLAPVGAGMLNGIGIQNPGVDAWTTDFVDGVGTADVGVEVWGSAVGHHVDDFGAVATALSTTDVRAIEINLSCPNLDGGPGAMYALDPRAASAVVTSVRSATTLDVGAKLSPNAVDIVEVATAVAEAGADWVVLTNTAWGAGIDTRSRRPLLSGVVGGLSGPPLKALALRCVWQVSQELPDLPIVGCGGVSTAEDVVEYLLAGASAVAIGTAHFAKPRIAGSIVRGLETYCDEVGVSAIRELTGAAEPW